MAKVIGGKYELGRVIGEGTLAKVRLAVEIETRQEYACKVVALSWVDINNEKHQDRMKREIGTLKQIQHKNVCGLREVMQSKRHLYFITELVSGGSLLDELRRSPQLRFSEELARRYFQQLVVGLLYCHIQEVVHRDLKPQNLLLHSSGMLKIADFGLASMLSVDSYQKTLVQTPHYVAPEQLRGMASTSVIAQASDVWSCGVILFVMLTGSVPFDKPEDAKDKWLEPLWESVKVGEFNIPRFVSPEAQELLVRMLTVNPEVRCSLEYVVAHPWFQEHFDRVRLDEGCRVDDETGEIQEQVFGAKNPIITQLLPQQLAAPGAQLSAIHVCEHLRSFIFNSDHTQRVFLYNSSLGETLKELVDLLTRLKFSPKVMKENMEIKAHVSQPRVVTFNITLESLLLPNRTLVEINLSSGQPPEFATANGPFDEVVRIIRGNLLKGVSEEVAPTLE